MSTKKGRYGSPRKRKPVVGDLAKLAQPSGIADPRTLGGSMSGPGGSRDRNGVVIDVADSVLMDTVDVSVMEAVRGGVMDGRVTFMMLGGRVNKTTRRVQVGFMFPPDGAAAIITELLAIADRDGVELLDDLTRRLTELHQGKNVDLHFLRAAIDNAIDSSDAPS